MKENITVLSMNEINLVGGGVNEVTDAELAETKGFVRMLIEYLPGIFTDLGLNKKTAAIVSVATTAAASAVFLAFKYYTVTPSLKKVE